VIADRVVPAALKLVLEPIFEADFLQVSYGFRPPRRARDAIAEIRMFGSMGWRWVLDEIDLSVKVRRCVPPGAVTGGG